MGAERIDQILAENVRKLRANADYGKAAHVTMPFDRVNQAYRSFVDIMDMIADQGDNTSETMVIEAIDDILSAWLDARETREMIRYIITGVRSGDIGPDAEMEIAKTRHYLTEQGL